MIVLVEEFLVSHRISVAFQISNVTVSKLILAVQVRCVREIQRTFDLLPERRMHAQLNSRTTQDSIAYQNPEKVQHLHLLFCILSLTTIVVQHITVSQITNISLVVVCWDQNRQTISHKLIAHIHKRVTERTTPIIRSLPCELRMVRHGIQCFFPETLKISTLQLPQNLRENGLPRVRFVMVQLALILEIMGRKSIQSTFGSVPVSR